MRVPSSRLRYLYVRLGDGKIMAEFLDQYEDWLRSERARASARGLSPLGCRGILPGEPNREEWPYDPSPLVVETRPRPANPSVAGKELQGKRPEATTR